MSFIEKLTLMTTRSPNISGFLAELLKHIRLDCENELIYPKLAECTKMITERFNSFYVSNFKLSEIQMKMLAAALCLSGKDLFLSRFDEVITIVLLRIRERIYSNTSLLIINEMLDTYYNKYSDSWATILDRTESILMQIFPHGRKNVLGCEGDVSMVVKILDTVTKKLPRFSYNEIIKKLFKQCNQTQGTSQILDNFPWDRASIALQTFLNLCSSNTIKNNNNNNRSSDNLVWKAEYSKVKIGDLELESMSENLSELIRSIFIKLTRQYWKGHLNEFVFDQSKTKLIGFIKLVLNKFLVLIEPEIILNLIESNNNEVSDLAKKVFIEKLRETNKTDELVHRIGNMIFGQSFKLEGFDDKTINSKDDAIVYKFFKNSFDRNYKEIPEPPENLQENYVLRGGIFYILESITTWSQTKLSDPTISGKLDSQEIELFGKIVDVYFRLLSAYEALIKTVYLEKQSDRNILLRSWSSLVGFKRNSKEIADFLVSLLGYSDERLRWRVIESFRYLPSNRLGEFMKLFDRFRLAVSEDFVNLKRSRRNDKAKIEITRVYRNVLLAWNPQESNSLTPLRMILRHVIELYYYVSKNELIDEFIWNLRGEFCGLMKEYLHVTNVMPANGTRKSFLPLKFHLEVWLTVDEWYHKSPSIPSDSQKLYHELFIDNFRSEIEELFANFAYNLPSAVASIDPSTLPVFIDNLLVKMSQISQTNSDLKSRYAYNLLKSSCEGQWSYLIFTKMVEFIGNGRDDLDEKIQGGVLSVLKESEEAFKGPSLELFKLMLNDSKDDICDLEGVLEMFTLISSSKWQRKILLKLRETFESSSNAIVFNEKIFENLFEISGKLLETFPNSLRALWQSIDEKYLDFVLFLLQKHLQRCQDGRVVKICKFIYESVYNDKVQELWLKYAHPYSGVKKRFKYSPVQATLKLLGYDENERSHVVRVLHQLTHVIEETGNRCCYELDTEDCYELMRWAVQCPMSKISLAAWKELKCHCKIVSDEFVDDLIKETKRFLQHLVCPATLSYFDADLVAEVLEFFELFLKLKFKETNRNTMLIKDIIELAKIQLSTKDSIVFESACSIIKSCLHCGWEDFDVDILHELSRRPSLSADLLLEMLQSENRIGYEKYSLYLTAFLPYLFRFFEEELNLSTSKTEDFDYSAELEYLKLLRLASENILIEEAQVDESGKLCLLELSEFFLSIEKRKKRNSIDFYKTLAGLLSDKSLNKFVTKLIFKNLEISVDWDGFLVHFFDNLRAQDQDISVYEGEAFGIANALCNLPADPIRQRVIDFLLL